MKKLKFFAIIIIILSSCCTGTNFTSYPNNPVETQVQLKQKNFKVVKRVTGVHKATYVFGIGGLSKKALQESALTNMYNDAQLTGSQTIINITTVVSTKMIFGPIYMRVYAKATGTVIEFIDEGTNTENTDSNTTKNENSIKTKDSLIVTTEQPLKEIEVGSEESINLSDKTFLKACISLGLDKNGDGEISEKEAYLVKNLNIRFWGIKDLTGIEHFKYLKELDASKNLFSEADLSKNIYLKKVKISSKHITKVILPKNSNTISIDIEKNKIIEK